MPEIYEKFIKSSILISLTVGCALGAILIAMIGFSYKWWVIERSIIQAHGHAQIFGWVGLMIMGVAYQVIPRLKAAKLYSTRLANTSYTIMISGIILSVVSQPLVQNSVFAVTLAVSGILELLAGGLFVFTIWKTINASKQTPEIFEDFIKAGLSWFLLQAVVTTVIFFTMAANRATVIPSWAEGSYLQMQIFGFILMIILGITVRTLPLFMGLREPDNRFIKTCFVTVNLGVILTVAASWTASLYPAVLLNGLKTAAAALTLIGVAAFIYGLNVFRRPIVDMSDLHVDRSYERYVKVAYVWLPVAAAMLLTLAIYEAVTGVAVEHAFVGAYRHAVTVGFISMMIMGYASRIIPVFRGVKLYSVTLSVAAFWLVNVGNVLRVGSEILVGFFQGSFFPIMGASGSIEVFALALFGYNIFQTMETPVEAVETRKEESVAAIVTKDMKISDILERHPYLLEVLVKKGFTPLQNPVLRRIMARTITFEKACVRMSLDVDTLLTDINRIVEEKRQGIEQVEVEEGKR